MFSFIYFFLFWLLFSSERERERKSAHSRKVWKSHKWNHFSYFHRISSQNHVHTAIRTEMVNTIKNFVCVSYHRHPSIILRRERWERRTICSDNNHWTKFKYRSKYLSEIYFIIRFDICCCMHFVTQVKSSSLFLISKSTLVSSSSWHFYHFRSSIGWSRFAYRSDNVGDSNSLHSKLCFL